MNSEKIKKFLGRFAYNSKVVLTLVLLSFMVWVLGVVTHDKSTWLLFSTYRGSPLDPLFYVRFFASVLGSVSWGHFSDNGTAILLIGPTLEERYGSKRLLFMILVTVFVTGTAHLILDGGPVTGSSDIVFMMIVLLALLSCKGSKIPLTAVILLAIYYGYEFVDLFKDNGVSNLSHILGGVCGGVFSYLFRRTVAPGPDAAVEITK